MRTRWQLAQVTERVDPQPKLAALGLVGTVPQACPADRAWQSPHPLLCMYHLNPERKGAQVAAGNEAVLRARFQDAQFFYQEDLKGSLEQFRPALGGMMFHAELGEHALQRTVQSRPEACTEISMQTGHFGKIRSFPSLASCWQLLSRVNRLFLAVSRNICCQG